MKALWEKVSISTEKKLICDTFLQGQTPSSSNNETILDFTLGLFYMSQMV